MIAFLIYSNTIWYFTIESYILKLLLLIVSLALSLGIELGLGYSVDFNKKLEMLLGGLMIVVNVVCSTLALYYLYLETRYYIFTISFLISAIIGFLMYNQYVSELDHALNRHRKGDE